MNKHGRDVNHTKTNIISEIKEVKGKIKRSAKLEFNCHMKSNEADPMKDTVERYTPIDNLQLRRV